MPPTAQMFKLISDWRKQRIETMSLRMHFIKKSQIN